MASRDTPRGVSPVLRGVCANLLWKRSKAALSYSTPENGSLRKRRKFTNRWRRSTGRFVRDERSWPSAVIF